MTSQHLRQPWHPAQFWSIEPEKVRCELCPHLCSLGNGESGQCHVRKNIGGALKTSARGASVKHFTPVERKPLYHYRPGLEVLTLAVPGCTFACAYCQNYRLSQYGRDSSATWHIEPLHIEQLVREASARNSAIAFSYSEPVLAAELTLDIAQAGRSLGIPILWKSNGYITEKAAETVGAVLDAVNLDIKASGDRRHRAFTGASVEPVWETLAHWHAQGVWIEVSTPLIPKISDGLDHVASIADRIARISPDIPWHLLRFNPEYKMRSRSPTPPALLAGARSVALAAGLKHVYAERALGAEGRTTFCSACGTAAVTRGIYHPLSVNLEGSACAACQSPIAGIWL